MSQTILNLLKKNDNFISGEKISVELGITRAAVWKKIQTLRKKGFIIISAPSKGYKLVEYPDLSEDEISAQVKGNFWKKFLYYETVDSTNEIAASLSLKNDLRSGTVIIADSQAQGRGRLGRTWISPPGLNIYISILLKPEIEPKNVTFLTLITAIACSTALRKISGLNVVIKWPNDLIVSEKKIGGILTEVRSEPDKIRIAIIGIGINVNISNKEFPDALRTIATSVKNESGQQYSRSKIIVQILKEFEYWYTVFK